MTEQEWLGCSEPRLMLNFLWRKAFGRRIHLFGCACCRMVWHLLVDERSRNAVDQAERYADGLIDLATVELSSTAAHNACVELKSRCNPGSTTPEQDEARLNAAEMAEEVAPSSWYYIHEIADGPRNPLAVSTLLRCIFGNPFRPATLDPAWRTSTVVALARGIYDDRAFDRLPILADALQDAGCDSADILNHCRDAGPHARGCWVVDLVLGKQ